MRRVAVNASASKFLSKLPSMECFTSVCVHSHGAFMFVVVLKYAAQVANFCQGAIGANLASKLGNHGLTVLHLSRLRGG